MEQKFKVGQKVAVMDNYGGHNVGDVLTVASVEAMGRTFSYEFSEGGSGLSQCRLEAYTPIAEERAPILWQSYCNVLNEEALAALRQVIEDVENHEGMVFEDKAHLMNAFRWDDTEQGYDFWDAVDEGKYNKTSVATSQEQQSNKEDIGFAATSKPVKSDGGSSDYYKISVKTSHGVVNVEVNDIIYAMVGGDFDLANILKAARRMYLASKGCGKEGVDIAYDARKVAWFCDDFVRRFGDVC